MACAKDATCVDESSWQLGVALGVGVRTNPLVDGDNIPLVILPDIAWYGEKAYFDNGELGYQWLAQEKFAFETFLQVDRERAFFSFVHPANIFLATESFSPATPSLPSQDVQNNRGDLSIQKIATRKWAINAGIRGHYFVFGGEWLLSVQQDISNVHKGHKVALEYSHSWKCSDFKVAMRIGSVWKSAGLIDYYYGVSQRDTKQSEFYFTGKSGWQPYVSLNLHKPINERWSWLASIGYRKLPSSLVNSPLVDQNYIQNIFLGAAYRF